MMDNLSGARIHITGIVQGVGFRPFVFGLATRLALNGWVRNTSAGVDIEVDGPPELIQQFYSALKNETPPLARIDTCEISPRPPNGFTTFEIIHSAAIQDAFQPISPDVSICPDCLAELLDPADRRFLYPFINCTNCGPRFTIIKDIPYDRPNTTMAGFPLCPDCAAEYHDPLNRRFHAQPVACPVCGPRVWLESPQQISQSAATAGDVMPSDLLTEQCGRAAIQIAQRLLLKGNILAIKGLGGFHLACDATNPAALQELRRRKLRVDKPFALMMPDLRTVKMHCLVTPHEEELLLSRQRPIVILQRRPDSKVSREVAPLQDTIGVMLPYTPLHYLLYLDFLNLGSQTRPTDPRFLPLSLVMTSGNLSEEPIATQNPEARQRLSSLADVFLMHNRPIQTRCDDSVLRVFDFGSGSQVNAGLLTQSTPTASLFLRRSRGYAPDPILLPWEFPPVLATGPEIKNTFCLTRDRYAFISQHVGDMENFETLQSFETGIQEYEHIFRIHPQLIACDLHPNYLATRYAIQRAEKESIPYIAVQHHHAHIASCMADNGLPPDQAVIGIAFDGTGYGTDGAIWGGEFLFANYRGFQRFAHLTYMPLSGGDAAIRKISRLALAYLKEVGVECKPDLPSYLALSSAERSALYAQLEHRLNTPLTSSMGRLFDVVAALVGVRQQINYEAQAAIELEALVDPEEKNSYQFGLHPAQLGVQTPCPIDIAPVLRAILDDLDRQLPSARISARFHNSVVALVHRVVLAMRSLYNADQVVLSGGVWQNMVLLRNTVEILQQEGFEVFIHRQVPTNDGGIALGQAAIAAQHIDRGG